MRSLTGAERVHGAVVHGMVMTNVGDMMMMFIGQRAAQFNALGMHGTPMGGDESGTPCADLSAP